MRASAPATLPAVVDIAGGRVRLRALPTPELAAIVCDDPKEVIRRLAYPDEWHALDQAMRSPAFEQLDITQVRAAGAGVAARLCGLDATMTGWRTAFRLCASLFHDPPAGWALPVSAGIDPTTAPLWVVVAAVWARAAEGRNDDKMAELRREFTAPLPGEAYWRGAMPTPEGPARPDPRSRAERTRRAYRNRSAAAAIRSGKLR
jgi:hypothetical protein